MQIRFFLLMFLFVLVSNVVLANGGGGLPRPPRETKYAVICIKNDLGMDIIYNAWWGENNGKEFTITKDKSEPHWYQYAESSDGKRSSPDFFIDFPTDKSNSNKRKTLKLKYYGSFNNECYSGKKYIFRLVGKNTIGLFDEFE